MERSGLSTVWSGANWAEAMWWIEAGYMNQKKNDCRCLSEVTKRLHITRTTFIYHQEIQIEL